VAGKGKGGLFVVAALIGLAIVIRYSSHRINTPSVRIPKFDFKIPKIPPAVDWKSVLKGVPLPSGWPALLNSKAGKRGTTAKPILAAPPVPTGPILSDPYETARSLCKEQRCGEAVRGLSTLPRTEPTAQVMRELLPRAIEELAGDGQRATARKMLDLAKEIGVSIDRERWERRLREGALRDALVRGNYSYREPSIHGDRIRAHRSSFGYDFHKATRLEGADGCTWLRSSHNPSYYALASAVSSAGWGTWSVGVPGFADSVRLAASSGLPFGTALAIWWDPFWAVLKILLEILAVYLLITTLFAPRYAGKLLRRLGMKRLAHLFFAFACVRVQRSALGARLGPSIDYARSVDWRVRRRMVAAKRERLLAKAVWYLEPVATYSAKGQAWLARIYFLQGRLLEARRMVDESLSSKPTAFARIERARISLAQGDVDAAVAELERVAWWRTLSAQGMLLRAIAAARAQRYPASRRWLFFARRSREVRRQSHLLLAALREARGDLPRARAAATRAARFGMAAAAVWLARTARHLGDSAGAKRWAQIGLPQRPDDPRLQVEAALADAAGLDATIDVARRFPESAEAVEAAYARAAQSGTRHPYLDARAESAPAAARGAVGDYAYRLGDPLRALRAWRDAAATQPAMVPVLERRARALIAEALASQSVWLAVELAETVRLGGEIQEEVARRGLFAFLEGARTGAPAFLVPPSGAVSPEARTLYHVLRGNRLEARAALAQSQRLPSDVAADIDRLLAPGATTTAELLARWGDPISWAANGRVRRLRSELARCREAVQGRRFAEALKAHEVVRTWICDELPASRFLDAALGLDAREGETAAQLSTIGELHPDPMLRAMAAHDLAVVAADGRDGSSEAWKSWSRAWDETLASTAYRAYLRRRVLEIQDARLTAQSVEESIEQATGLLAEDLRGWLEGVIVNGGSRLEWVPASPIGLRAAQAIVEELTRDIEQHLEHATPRVSVVPAEEIWRTEGAALEETLRRLRTLNAAPERQTSLEENVCRLYINLGVDANALGSYSLAITITLAAHRLARSPAQEDLCRKNLAIYRSNLAANRRPPGRS
jgi:hypothetical protein